MPNHTIKKKRVHEGRCVYYLLLLLLVRKLDGQRGTIYVGTILLAFDVGCYFYIAP